MGAQTTRQIKRQIKGVKNVKQITHAMEMVSAAKLKRVEQKLDSIRPYWEKVREIFGHLLQVLEDPEGELLQTRDKVNSIGIIVIAGEKGLCGGYNSDLFSRADEFIETLPEDADKKIFGIGKKCRNWVRKKPYELMELQTDLPTEPSFELARRISSKAEKHFMEGKIDAVYIVYTHFINALKQRPTTFQFLPVEPEKILKADMSETAEEGREEDETGRKEEEHKEVSDYIFEPDPDQLLDIFLPRYVNMLFYTILLESLSSEHGARMVAMRNATDNAEEKIDDLEYTYNQARQESITRELLEIVGAVEALEGT